MRLVATGKLHTVAMGVSRTIVFPETRLGNVTFVTVDVVNLDAADALCH